MSPEWQNSGLITVKSDVYSFGVVLLEIVCCRSNFEVNVSTADVVLLSTWVYNCFIAKELNKLVGEDEEVDLRTLETMVRVGLLCIQDEPNLRPSMKNVILMLEGTMEIPVVPFPILSNFSSRGAVITMLVRPPCSRLFTINSLIVPGRESGREWGSGFLHG
ncbi:hypothetical protein WN944_000425 [Citrus x changshan-huyou]|uniref:Serine-threonine/tyrosine-protein kinase catalytic domain-containing protein n=1 Tax=Citrus x changshan-huyou TaxID=2935761 RepID=A0AAP0MJ68_9ROSI